MQKHILGAFGGIILTFFVGVCYGHGEINKEIPSLSERPATSVFALAGEESEEGEDFPLSSKPKIIKIPYKDLKKTIERLEKMVRRLDRRMGRLEGHVTHTPDEVLVIDEGGNVAPTSLIGSLKGGIHFLKEALMVGKDAAIVIVAGCMLFLAGYVLYTFGSWIYFVWEWACFVGQKLKQVGAAIVEAIPALKELRAQFLADIAAGYQKGFTAWMVFDPAKTLAGNNVIYM